MKNSFSWFLLFSIIKGSMELFEPDLMVLEHKIRRKHQQEGRQGRILEMPLS